MPQWIFYTMLFKRIQEYLAKPSRENIKVKKILLVCPKAPSGASWLLNALIKMGIRVVRSSSPSPGTFVKLDNGYYKLNDAELNLKLHFPVLSETDNFFFIDNVVVEWTHDWPTINIDVDNTFLLVRDPRDALFSLYRRRNAKVNFKLFLDSLDYLTLLSQLESWVVFVRAWLDKYNNITVLRFEDFKADPETNLLLFLERIGVGRGSSERIREAINSSSVENARQMEVKYKNIAGSYFSSESALNRKGMPYEWRSQFDIYESEYKYITQKCSELIAFLGYETLSTTNSAQLKWHEYRGLSFDSNMPDDSLKQRITEVGVEGVVNILILYDEFNSSDNLQYGYYEDWELKIFEKNIDALIRLTYPQIYFDNQGVTTEELVKLVLKYCITSQGTH